MHISLQHVHGRLPFVQVSLDAGTSSRDRGLGGGSGGLGVRHVCGAAVWCQGCVSCPVPVLRTPMDPTEREREKDSGVECELVKGEGTWKEVGGDIHVRVQHTCVYTAVRERGGGGKRVKGQ